MYITAKDATGTVHLLHQSDDTRYGIAHAAVVSAEEAEHLDQALGNARAAARDIEELQRERHELEAEHAKVVAERDECRAEVDRLRRDLDLMRAAELAAQSDPTQTMPVTPPRATPPPETAGPFVLPPDHTAGAASWSGLTGSASSAPSPQQPSGNGTPPGGTPLDDLVATLAPDADPDLTQLAADLDPPRRGRRGNGKSREVPAGGSGD